MDALKYDVSDFKAYGAMLDRLPAGYVIFGRGPIAGGFAAGTDAKVRQMSRKLSASQDIPMQNIANPNHYHHTPRGSNDVLFWYSALKYWEGEGGLISISTNDVFAIRQDSRLFELVSEIFPHMRHCAELPTNLMVEDF